MDVLTWPNPWYLDGVEYMELVHEAEDRAREAAQEAQGVDDDVY
jgi:hypothetical protein